MKKRHTFKISQSTIDEVRALSEYDAKVNQETLQQLEEIKSHVIVEDKYEFDWQGRLHNLLCKYNLKFSERHEIIMFVNSMLNSEQTDKRSVARNDQ